jgi:TrmH family RNA methyltransferase
MGALFAVPLARFAAVAELPGETVALDAHAGEPIASQPAPAAAETTILVGAERAGLPPAMLAACGRVARIPIRSESLNAAMAATVALYELTRGPDHRMGAA